MSERTKSNKEFNKAQTERPEYVTEEHLEYLDELRESGITNMLGARPYLIEEFNLPSKQAAGVLRYWLKSVRERHPK